MSNSVSAAFMRDANHVPITGLGLVESKTVTLDGTTGVTGVTNLFTVTGNVVVQLFAKCTVDLVSAGGGTIRIGITGNDNGLINTTTATDLDAGESWVSTAPNSIAAIPSQRTISADTSIIQTIGVATITAGTLTYYCLWYPLSEDSSVVVA